MRDTAQALKPFHRDAISADPLFEGMHRVLPPPLGIHGFRALENPLRSDR